MKCLYVFFIFVAISLDHIEASSETSTEQNQKKINCIQNLDKKILTLIQDKKRLDNSFSTHEMFTPIPEKFKKIDNFIHELQIYRDAIYLDKKEEASLARKNIRTIKENLEAELKDF